MTNKLHIHFKTQSITLKIGTDTFRINIPVYDVQSYLAMDANGDIYVYAVEPHLEKDTYACSNQMSSNTFIATYQNDGTLYAPLKITESTKTCTLKKIVKQKYSKIDAYDYLMPT